jgi:hypothetical protein
VDRLRIREPRPGTALLLQLGTWVFCLSLSADTVYLTPSADTTLLQAYPANNFGGNEYLNSGTTQNFATNRALLKFNVAAALPRGAKITGAALTIAVVGTPADGNAPSNFLLHRMLRDWGEGNKSGHPPQQAGLGQPATANEATWQDRFAFTTNVWAAPGAAPGLDFMTNISAETYVYGIDFSPYTFNSTSFTVADVQGWLNQPQSNFGWLLVSQGENSYFSARRFASREDANRAPVLVVDYFVPRINRVTMAGNAVNMQFLAEPGQAYTVEYNGSAEPAGWLVLTNISPLPAQTNVLVQDGVTSAQRYYRLSLP